MEKIKIDFKNTSSEDVEFIADKLAQGRVIVYPTDTIYGLGCLATEKKAIAKIFKIKKRNKGKALLVLVKSWCMLKKYFYVSGKQERYLRTFWPGPVSVILKKREILPNDLAPGKEAVAVRLPKNDFLIKILKKVDIPIVSTSLNVSGDKHLEDVSDLDNYFKTVKPDLVVNIGRKLKGKPSRLIDLTDVNNIKILRK